MLIIFELFLNQKDISIKANADNKIVNQLNKNMLVLILELIPISLIGNPNIPAPIDVPAIKKMQPNILFNMF